MFATDPVSGQSDLGLSQSTIDRCLQLNDVLEGGGTGIPEADVLVTPKKGSALLWSVCIVWSFTLPD